MSHLTLEQKYVIAVMYQNGKKKSEITADFGRNKSVISREINRNCDKRSGKYEADLAQRKCEKRHKEKVKKTKLTVALKEYIDKLLVQNTAPSKSQEQPEGKKNHVYAPSGSISISGRIKNRRGLCTSISAHRAKGIGKGALKRIKEAL